MKTLLTLLLCPCLAFGQTIQISSPRNIINSDVTTAIGLTPIDGSGNPVAALAQGWPASATIQETTTFAFPASSIPYTFVGIEADVSPRGTGFNTKRSALVDYLLNPPLHVPSGVPVNAVYYAPTSGLGSITITLGKDTTPPSAPTLSAVTSQTSSVVSWTAATDNVGVAGYMLERATGTVTFGQIAMTTATTFADSGLTLATVYSYRVRAADAAGNSGPYSNIATVMTTSPLPTVATSTPGQCTAPAALTGCVAPNFQPQLVDATGGVWTLVGGKPFLNAKVTNNPYAPNIKYLFAVQNGAAIQIRSQNVNGTYACWTGAAWGC